MIYTDKTKKAMKLCYEAHAGQTDKSGLPYFHHPMHLADQMDDEDSTVVALLHDVVEDTEYTFSDLEAMGFGDAVIGALRLLTHDDSVPYLDYVREIAKNPIARKVKLADLTHNSDLTRLDREPTEKDLERVEKYRKAKGILLEEESAEACAPVGVFRRATMDEIPELVDFRVRQLIDEGQTPWKDIKETNIAYFREHFASGQMEEWVCDLDGRIIATGAIIWYVFPPSFDNGAGLKAYITNIYTEPEFRGRGIAPKMIELLDGFAKERGACRVWLEASKWGKPVYAKYGMSVNDTIMTLEYPEEDQAQSDKDK
ncbi:MAG: GNAT family N-acetyltransferase [Mogibacterium sp.]|nr:GNAT family N-acetyltransferase [Mogibacterium sp.]